MPDIDEQLQELFDTVGRLSEKGHYASSSRVYGEIRRLAKAEERVVEYMLATFHQADISANLLQPAHGRDLSVDLIALVESADRARVIQANLPERYDETVAWMTTCVYDKLADGTAMVEGYNSPGMHESVQEGIQVCRRAGKLECIKCFREYAVDVYRAADDLDMALHNARIVASGLGPETVRGDRRWLGTNQEARLLLLTGELARTEEACARALELAETYHTAITSHIETSLDMETILLLAGRQSEIAGVEVGSRHCVHFPETQPPVVGEYADLDLEFALRDALLACCHGNPQHGIDLLTPWDKLLLERKFLDRWFDVRLRLVAMSRLMRDDKKSEALAVPLEKKARFAQDWLTLRRLKALREQPFPISPLALPYALTAGPYSKGRTSMAAPDLSGVTAGEAADESVEATTTTASEGSPATDTDSAAVEPPETPLKGFLTDLHTRWKEAEDSSHVEFVDALLSQDSAAVSHPRDAAKLLQLMEMLSPPAERSLEIFKWARTLVDQFATETRVLSAGALLVGLLRDQPQSQLHDSISDELPETWLKKALQLDPDDWGNFGRAGMFHLQRENIAEAERCFARAFRLERKNNFLASRLAEIYSHTDRPRDALEVLDMCLRAGTAEPGLLFEAAMLAYRLDRPQAVLTYFDRYEELEPGQRWVQYYRALALLDLKRPAEAEEAIEREATLYETPSLNVAIVRACVAGALDDLARLPGLLTAVEQFRLADVDDLTLKGLVDLFTCLWRCVSQALERDPAFGPWHDRLEARLLAGGLLPDDAFTPKRTDVPKEDVSYFVVRIRQPLGADWRDWPGCLHGQDDWKAYVSNWGVLAVDEPTARATVLEWQSRCAPLPAEIIEILPQDEAYRDSPGIVWQGPHFSDDDDDDFNDELNDDVDDVGETEADS